MGPTKKNRITFLLVNFWTFNLLWNSFFSTMIYAQTVATLPYQGRVIDNQGEPVGGIMDFQFKFYSAQNGSTPEYTIELPGIEVIRSVFNIAIPITTEQMTKFQKEPQIYLDVIATPFQSDPILVASKQQYYAVPFALKVPINEEQLYYDSEGKLTLKESFTEIIVKNVIGKKGSKGETGAKGDTGLEGRKGDRGPVGAKGSTGPQGAEGDAGTDGTDGVSWFSGEGTPNDSTGSEGDFYLDSSNDKIYLKGSSSWSQLLSIGGGSSGAMTWSRKNASFTAEAQNGYIIDGISASVTATIPEECTMGQRIRILYTVNYDPELLYQLIANASGTGKLNDDGSLLSQSSSGYPSSFFLTCIGNKQWFLEKVVFN